MSQPEVIIRCDAAGRVYQPGETLRAEYRIDSVEHGEIKAIEVSVLWYTEGKGDQDLAVHEFRRITVDDRSNTDARCPGQVASVLPNSPLSYEGHIIKLRWCVRVRAFLTRGREALGQFAFRLGNVPPARAAVKPKSLEQRKASDEEAQPSNEST